MRRILVGLEVVRPRCATGAPPRPRLRSTAPDTDQNEAKNKKTTKDPPLRGSSTQIRHGPERGQKQENNQGSTFTGVLNSDKEDTMSDIDVLALVGSLRAASV